MEHYKNNLANWMIAGCLIVVAAGIGYGTFFSSIFNILTEQLERLESPEGAVATSSVTQKSLTTSYLTLYFVLH